MDADLLSQQALIAGRSPVAAFQGVGVEDDAAFPLAVPAWVVGAPTLSARVSSPGAAAGAGMARAQALRKSKRVLAESILGGARLVGGLVG
jgi:hypothetical protein